MTHSRALGTVAILLSGIAVATSCTGPSGGPSGAGAKLPISAKEGHPVAALGIPDLRNRTGAAPAGLTAADIGHIAGRAFMAVKAMRMGNNASEGRGLLAPDVARKKSGTKAFFILQDGDDDAIDLDGQAALLEDEGRAPFAETTTNPDGSTTTSYDDDGDGDTEESVTAFAPRDVPNGDGTLTRKQEFTVKQEDDSDDVELTETVDKEGKPIQGDLKWRDDAGDAKIHFTKSGGDVTLPEETTITWVRIPPPPQPKPWVPKKWPDFTQALAKFADLRAKAEGGGQSEEAQLVLRELADNSNDTVVKVGRFILKFHTSGNGSTGTVHSPSSGEKIGDFKVISGKASVNVYSTPPVFQTIDFEAAIKLKASKAEVQ